MIVYNITFHIDADVLDKALAYLKKEYIPAAIASGILQNPCLRRILSVSNDEGESFSIQFHAENEEKLDKWIQNEGLKFNETLIHHFGHKISGFATLLEDVDWEK